MKQYPTTRASLIVVPKLLSEVPGAPWPNPRGPTRVRALGAAVLAGLDTCGPMTAAR